MSLEVVKPGSTEVVAAPKALTLTSEEAAGFHEAFATNVGNGEITEFDLQRIKIMNGAAFWLIPKLEGEKPEPLVEGVIVYARDIRAYWASKETRNVPPDCSSTDAITGVCKPGVNLGGECQKCPMALFGSAKEGDGQACKQMKQLFMLRGDSMFPDVISLPPTSLKNAKKFFLKLASQSVPYYQGLVQIPLETAQNGAGQTYGKASMKFIRRLTPEEIQRAIEFHEQVKGFITRVPVTAADAGGVGE
jgi:hypothetical protein